MNNAVQFNQTGTDGVMDGYSDSDPSGGFWDNPFNSIPLGGWITFGNGGVSGGIGTDGGTGAVPGGIGGGIGGGLTRGGISTGTLLLVGLVAYFILKR